MEEKETQRIVKRRTHAQRLKRVLADATPRHLEQLTKKARALAGTDEPEDVSCEAISGRLASLHQRHAELKERLASGSEKLIGARLRQEFEDAQAEGTSVIVEDEAWNDGIIATLREHVHRDVGGQEGINDSLRTLYEVDSKIICGLRGGRIGIQYNTSFSGESFESYYLVLASRSFLEKMFVSEHTIPFFMPLRELEKLHLSSSATKFIDCIGELLQGYVSRREQIRLFKDLKANKIRHMSHSVPSDVAQFMVEEQNCKVTVNLGYELSSELPTRTKVLAWPLSSHTGINRIGRRASKPKATSYSLAYAEDSLKRNLLHHAFEEIVQNLSTTLRQILPTVSATPVPATEVLK